ncbi:hypothetical protein [Paracoccus alkanivorans]|uniref:hypothetical protein n=1 Tax=Paracoccus alkanivorans TaxID=2116655 RepID=UPI001AA0226F|nr:hypothetical protein [Paracoccus alkanivorans]
MVAQDIREILDLELLHRRQEVLIQHIRQAHAPEIVLGHEADQGIEVMAGFHGLRFFRAVLQAVPKRESGNAPEMSVKPAR